MTAVQQTLRYAPSGRVAWQAPFKVFVYGGLAATILAVIYAAVVRYNPFVYLSFIATLAFGVGLGVAAATTAEAGLSRSRRFNLVAGLMLGLWGLWLHWVMWAYLTYDDGLDSAKALAMSGPAGWMNFLLFTSQHLHVTFGRLGRHGPPVSEGVLLWVWAIEALVIVGLSALGAAWASGNRPFSEVARQWANTDWAGEFTLPMDEAGTPASAEEITRRLTQADGLEGLTSLPRAPAAPLCPTLKLKLVGVPDDPLCRFFSLGVIERTTKTDARGRAKTSSREVSVTSNQQLDSSRYAQLVQRLTSNDSNAAPA
jgi:hypothetical protein